jgi:hypothetical protein
VAANVAPVVGAQLVDVAACRDRHAAVGGGLRPVDVPARTREFPARVLPPLDRTPTGE